jgi:hypothetical protein
MARGARPDAAGSSPAFSGGCGVRMLDHEGEHTADSAEPGISSGSADLQDELRDEDLRREIELVSDLVVAASASAGPLSLVEIDRILGLRPT